MGLSSVTTTLKSLASSVPLVDCEVATPLERSSAWSPTRVTWPLYTFPGMASMVTSAAWPIFTFTMSVSSTFTSAVTTLMSAMVIRVEPSAFWMPTTTVSPSRTGRLVTRPSNGATETVLFNASSLDRSVAVALFTRPRDELVCALAWANWASACATVAWSVSKAAFLASKSCLAMIPALYRFWARSQSSFFCSRSALACCRLASAVFSAAM